MGFVGFVGIFLGLLAFPFAFVERTRGRVAVFMLIWLLHIASTVTYFFYTQNNPSDAQIYYYDPYDMASREANFGTVFVVQLVQRMKAWLGGSYLDYFLFFQAFGFWGIVTLMRTLEEIYKELDLPQAQVAYLMLFLPGLHFWTSAIGKDAPLFFCTSVAVWAAMHLRRRFVAFGIAVAVMVLFRPHIALVTMVSLAIAAFFDPRSRGYVKVSLAAVATVGAAFVAGTVESTFSVDVTDADSVSDFFANRYAVGQADTGGTAVVGQSFIVRLFSLLFRPLFFDAEGAFGLIASLENLFYIFVIGTICIRMRETIRLVRRVFFLRFAIIFAVAVLLLLSLVYYNVGLGLRQKMMIVPPLFAFFAAHWAVGRVKGQAPQPGYA